LQPTFYRSLLTGIAWSVSTLLCAAQMPSYVPPAHDTGRPTMSGPDIPDFDNGAHGRAMLARREEARKIERHKRMVDSANRLLQMTQQFQADVKDRPLTPDDERRLDEIAKLARSVKDQMAGY
jgi:hypothetical protein